VIMKFRNFIRGKNTNCKCDKVKRCYEKYLWSESGELSWVRERDFIARNFLIYALRE
jgi:hypothetical protein